MKRNLPTCQHCGAFLLRTPSGAVCARGCGRIVRGVAYGRRLIEALAQKRIDNLARVTRRGKGKAARYKFVGEPGWYRRMATWPGKSVNTIASLVDHGCRLGINDGRVLALERERERERDEPGELTDGE